MKTIFYEKRTESTVVNNTVTFDEVYGNQSRPSGHRFGIAEGNNILMGEQAFQRMNEILPELPELPVKPERYLIIGETVWRKFPENQPEIYEGTYKARDAVNRNKIMFLEYRKPEDIEAFHTFKVYDFCKDYERDSFTRIPNPEYDFVLGQRAELKLQLAEWMKLNGIVPMAYVKYAGIPDSKGYRWYEVVDGIRMEIPVVKGLYPSYKFCPLIPHTTTWHSRFTIAVELLEKNPSREEFIKKMLAIS